MEYNPVNIQPSMDGRRLPSRSAAETFEYPMRSLEIRQNANNTVYVKNLSIIEVHSVDEVGRLSLPHTHTHTLSLFLFLLDMFVFDSLLISSLLARLLLFLCVSPPFSLVACACFSLSFRDTRRCSPSSMLEPPSGQLLRHR